MSAKGWLWKDIGCSETVAQFDIFRVADSHLVVDLQSDLIGLDHVRLVAPLRQASEFTEYPGLTPLVDFQNLDWIVRIPEMAVVSRKILGRPLGTISAHQDALMRAIDILTHGF